MAKNASLREPSAHIEAVKARAKKLAVKTSREQRAAKAPLNTSAPELAAAQLKRLDSRPGKSTKERAKLSPIAAQLKMASTAAPKTGTRRGRRRRGSSA